MRTFEPSYHWHQALTAIAAVLLAYGAAAVPAVRPLFVPSAVLGLTKLVVRDVASRQTNQRLAFACCGWWNIACAEVAWVILMLHEGLLTQIHRHPLCVLLGVTAVVCNAAAGCFTTTWRQRIATSILIVAQVSYTHLRTPESVLLFHVHEVVLLVVLFLAGAIGLAAQVQRLLGTAAEAQRRADRAQRRAEHLDLRVDEAQRRVEDLDMHAGRLERIRSLELVDRVLQRPRRQQASAGGATMRRPSRPLGMRPMSIPEAKYAEQ